MVASPCRTLAEPLLQEKVSRWISVGSKLCMLILLVLTWSFVSLPGPTPCVDCGSGSHMTSRAPVIAMAGHSIHLAGTMRSLKLPGHWLQLQHFWQLAKSSQFRSPVMDPWFSASVQQISFETKSALRSGRHAHRGGRNILVPAAQVQETVAKYIFGEQSVRAAVAAMREGKLVVVVDDENRENEGDLILAAAMATPESVGFMVRYTSGVLCVSLEQETLQRLRLPPMVLDNEDPKETAYTVSVDAKKDVSTGISAADRAITLRALADPSSTAADFTRPGHMFPLRYKEGGVLVRGGHTEASLDLTRLAGLPPGGALAEVVNDDGSMMRLESPNGGLRQFAQDHNIVLTSIQDIIAFRQRSSE